MFLESGPVRHSPATYIRYVCCMFLESGPVRHSPVQSSPATYIRYVCYMFLESGPVWHSPVQSGPVRSSPVRSSPVRHSPATYIRYVCCMFLESGPVWRSPLDTSLDTRRVQSGTAVRRIPLDTRRVQSGTTVRRIPLDTPLWTPLPFLTPEESSPAQSSGVQRTDHVTICDPSGSTVTPWSPADGPCDNLWPIWTPDSPVGHVGQCKVLVNFLQRVQWPPRLTQLKRHSLASRLQKRRRNYWRLANQVSNLSFN